MKLDAKDYFAGLTAVLTIGSVVWKGGQITQQLEATNEAVKQLAPVVTRLDATSARLEVRADANAGRLDDLTRRVENVEQRLNRRHP
jgi:hypothetical protein